MQPTQLKFSVSAKLHNRVKKDGKQNILVTYTYDKVTSVYTTAYSVTAECWDNKSKLARIGCYDGARINAKIQQTQEILLSIAGKLTKPSHELVKRLYDEQAYQASKQEMNSYLDLAIAIGEDEQISTAEQKLKQDKKALKERKKAFLPDREKFGLESSEQVATKAAVAELQALWLDYAGDGKHTENRKPDTKHKIRNQGTLKHYKEATYNSVVSMWKIVNEFCEYAAIDLTLANINMNFYHKFGDFLMFSRKVKQNDIWVDGELYYNNAFGSIIKRLKTFLKWIATEKGVTVHPQALSRKFQALEEENEIIILSDYQYQLLADFRNAPECKASWIKHIDITLFQTAVGLRHSDMKRATWFVTGEVINGVDNRVIKGNTMKNKSKYIIPVYLNKEWSLDILEKYNFDFNEISEASKKKGAKKSMNMVMFNRVMKEVLKALGEKHNIFQNTIRIFKKKWSEEYEIGAFKQWELHSSHDNRRAFITRMFRLKFTEKTISTMVGTKSLGELRKYQLVDDEDLFAARK